MNVCFERETFLFTDRLELQSHDQSPTGSLTVQNRALAMDFQRFQIQQYNDRLTLRRLGEYEEAISQLQDKLDQLRFNRKNR